MSAKEKLIESATKLFYSNGFHATGIEGILQNAKVSKMTLYRHFKSKDELILSVLRDYDLRFRNQFISFIENISEKPEKQLLAIFDYLHHWVTSKEESGTGFSGCLFVNASSEFSGLDNPIHRLAAEHKRLILEQLTSIAAKTTAKKPKELALAINLLYEGACVSVHVDGDTSKILAARTIAEQLLKAKLINA